MSSDLELSVIIPYYNSGEVLEQAVASVLQSDVKVECIIVDDGSTLSDSKNALQAVKKKFPEVVIFSQQNQGLSSARNVGADLANTEFLFFLDADDTISSGSLRALLSEARRFNTKDHVYFPLVRLTGSRSGWCSKCA